MADGNGEALVPVVENPVPADMARLSITFGGQQGDLPELVPWDATDENLKEMATETVRDGYVPGIDAQDEPDFTDYVVDRFEARPDVQFNRLALRPKTPFGA